MKPTSELYGALQTAYEHFNKTLFDGKLPHVIFTVQRQKGVMGYFSANRWLSKEGKSCHEIAINPTYVAESALIDVFQTLVHEQCHLLQFCYGDPGRRGYHNKEWGDMMQAVGLMPSSTGAEGGRKTGEKMSDYPIPDGKFLSECESLVSGSNFDLPWLDRFALRSSVTNTEQIREYELSVDSGVRLTTTMAEFFDKDAFIFEADEKESRNKQKYSCPMCGVNVWGKQAISIKCGDCDVDFIV
jgi:predicted SprT family Zn-dependent metalloprotease